MRVLRTPPKVLAANVVGTVSLQVVTQWFEYGQRPVNVGEYEVQVSVLSPIERKYWNGLVWADFRGSNTSAFQQYRWRGLAEKPEYPES